MKKILLLIFCMFSIIMLGAQQIHPIISKGKIEGIEIGMKIEDAQKILSEDFFVDKPSLVHSEAVGPGSQYIDVYKEKSRKKLLFSFTGHEFIEEIYIRSSLYKTSHGISVGMPLSSIRKNSALGEVFESHQHGLYITIPSINGGITLDVDYSVINYNDLDIATLPGNIKVYKIVLN